MISVHFQGRLFSITVIQVHAPTSNAEEAEVEWFYEDLQNLLELTPQKAVLFIIGDWNAKVGSQETCGVTVKFGLGIWNEAGQRLIKFCQENALLITIPLSLFSGLEACREYTSNSSTSFCVGLFQNPKMKRTSFLGVSSRRSCRSS